ncbi:hypothetical protein PR048_005396 [Dryococelus australis]|uniref:Post-GPI attachment to proteins factor 3 n=1 Tax=Dryococelus australis TaxID=614101 RepID=A0ABQ9I811_9NEOP|nr:hypothetical protein PR048_005396 [Dryococelus australis]
MGVLFGPFSPLPHPVAVGKITNKVDMGVKIEAIHLSLSFGCLCVLIERVVSSAGDQSPYYQKCVSKCTESNCSTDGWNFLSGVQPFYLQVTLWSCAEECQYNCMWKTVDAFMERKWDVPQFHGRWPFSRILGLQEPASVLFSFLNFCAHFYMLKVFRKEVPKSSPMFWLWHFYAAVCLNGWFWSCIFHTRDFPFTEKMDYFCAFSMVLCSFYCMCARILNGRSKCLLVLLAAFCFFIFLHHVTFMSWVKFDYGYNMMVNITVGIFNAVGWLSWSIYNREKMPYSSLCAYFIILVGICMLLELADFPPVFWYFDSHSLWHLSTAWLPFIFYKFLIHDCRYLLKQKYLDEKKTHVN